MHATTRPATPGELAEIDRLHEIREAAVRRACEVMGWPYSSRPVWSGLRAVATGKAVVVSVEKLHEMLDRIARRD